MLSSVVVSGLLVVGVDVDSVTLLLVAGVWVVGVFLTEKARDSACHSFRVKTMVRFSTAGRGGGGIMWGFMLHVFDRISS